VDLPPCCFLTFCPSCGLAARYNAITAGDYHNGECGHSLRLLRLGMRSRRADGSGREKVIALTELVKPWHENAAEWVSRVDSAQTGNPAAGWQTWSAAMYLYAAECVLQRGTPFFDDIRGGI